MPGILVFSFAFFGATQAYSQDVAEAARQARAKKDADQKNFKHIYTNEDLKHPVILTPEDSDQVQAKKNLNISPTGQPADAATDSIDARTAPAQIPLGDVARANRKQKLLQQKLQPEQSAQLHLPIIGAALGAPKPPVFPSAKTPANWLVITRPPQRPGVDFQPAVHPKKRSPFDRSFVPSSPAIRPALKAPAVPTLSSSPKPLSPSFATVVPTPRTKVFAAPPVVPALTPKVLAVPALTPKVLPTPPVVSAPAISSITLQPGDSLWKLAKQNLGRGMRWRELIAANSHIADPNRIAIGSRILIPPSTPVVRYAPSSGSKIKVQKGDTLWTLARTHLGHASSWSCIAQANPLLHDPNRIFAGQELLLPTSCSAFLP